MMSGTALSNMTKKIDPGGAARNPGNMHEKPARAVDTDGRLTCYSPGRWYSTVNTGC